MSYFARSNDVPAWAAVIPQDWQRDWLKWSVNLSTERPTDDEQERLPYISNEDIESWTGRLLNDAPKSSDSDSRKFKADDVLLNKLRPYLAKVYHADFDGVSSGELLCLRPSERVAPRYLFYVLASKGFIDAIDAETFGSKMPRADWEIVGHQPLPLPPMDVQRRIAGFLDEKTARIDALITKKRALLERLAEKRQALITRAVTQGLNSDAPRKPSGIDWLGEIPAHWEVTPLRHISPQITVGIVVTPAAYYAEADAEECILAIRGLNVRPMSFDFSDARHITADGHHLHLKSALHEGDLVAVRTGDPGTTAVITSDLEGVNCVDLVIIRKPKAGSSRFLGWFLNSDAARVQYALGSDGALQQHFNVSTSKEVVVPLPPADEQVAIANVIDRELGHEHERQRKVERSIRLLEEYRSALVTTAVTGQIEGLR